MATATRRAEVAERAATRIRGERLEVQRMQLEQQRIQLEQQYEEQRRQREFEERKWREDRAYKESTAVQIKT